MYSKAFFKIRIQFICGLQFRNEFILISTVFLNNIFKTQIIFEMILLHNTPQLLILQIFISSKLFITTFKSDFLNGNLSHENEICY